LASDVHKTVVGPLVRSCAAPVPEGDGLAVQRFPSGGEPLFPFLRGLRFLVGVEQKVSAFRAATVLGFGGSSDLMGAGCCEQRHPCR